MSGSKKVRWGVVGLGHRGQYLATLYHRIIPNSTVVALCDRFEMRAADALKALGDPDVMIYTDYDRMLKEAPIDAVAVIVEPENNADIVCRALESGKHVLCEVPLCYTIKDCWRIITTVEKTGLKFQMAEQTRYGAYVKAWKKMVDDGTLGKILYCEGQYLHGMAPDRYWIDAETGSPVTIEEAKRSKRKLKKSRFWHMKHAIFYLPHELSPLLHILGDRVVRVVGMATRPKSYRYEWLPVSDIEVALMHTKNDTVMRLMTGFVVATLQGSEHCNRMIGTSGWVEQPRTYSEKGKLWLADRYMADKADITWDYRDAWELPHAAATTGHGGLDYYPGANMVDAILHDAPLEMDVYASADTAAPAILAGISIEKGSIPLDVPDFRPGRDRKPGQMPKKLY